MKSGSRKRKDLTVQRASKRGSDGLWPERSDKARLVAQDDYEKRREAEIVAAIRERGAARVDAAQIAPTNSHGPEFKLRGYYLSWPFACKSCGKDEVWTPHQQKWFYEVAKGDPNAGPSRCRPCRAAERRRKADARRVHLDGVERKQRASGGTR